MTVDPSNKLGTHNIPQLLETHKFPGRVDLIHDLHEYSDELSARQMIELFRETDSVPTLWN